MRTFRNRFKAKMRGGVEQASGKIGYAASQTSLLLDYEGDPAACTMEDAARRDNRR
jgi:hypothetical protein